MNNLGWRILVVGGLAASLLLPPLAAAPAPSVGGPWLLAAPEYSSWKIEVTRTDRTPSDDPLLTLLNPLKEEVVTKAGSVARLKQTWTDGRQTEGWSINGLRIVNPRNLPPGRFTMEKPPVASADPAPAGAQDFPDLAWVAAENFRGMVSFEGRSCRLHEASILWQTDAPEPVRAWICDETRLPAAIEGQGVRWKYAITPASPFTLEVPAAMEKRIQLYRRGMHP